MYAIMNTRKSYDDKTSKSWWSDDGQAATLFETKAEATAKLDEIDGGSVMYLGHNEYSNRFSVKRLTPDQAHRLQTRGW